MHIPNEDAGKGRMRHAMPQIADFEAFLKDLDDNYIAYSTMEIDPEELTPTQGNFKEEKVDRIAAEWGQNKNAKPIVTSDDDYVLDGHHRWLAAAKLKMPIMSRVIGLGIDDLLDFVKGKPYIEKRGLHESVEFKRVSEYAKRICGVVQSAT